MLEFKIYIPGIIRFTYLLSVESFIILKVKKTINTSTLFSDGLNFRFDKYFRFDNSSYWKEYYKKKLENNDVDREKLYASIIQNNIGSSGRLLDIGSGMGFLLKEVAELGIHGFGIDLFREMLNEAKKYLSKTNVQLKKADILNLPFEKHYFDCIVVMSVIEHFAFSEIEDDILPYIKKFIKPGGYLFIHVPVRSHYSIFAKFIRKYVLRDLPEWAIDDDGDVTHKVWLSYKEYIKIIEDSGFELINYDFQMTRSNLKPRFLNYFMSSIQRLLSGSDILFRLSYENEPLLIKLMKKLKSSFSLTSYFLFRKV